MIIRLCWKCAEKDVTKTTPAKSLITSYILNGLTAPSTLGGEQFMKIVLAIRLPVLLKVIIGAEVLPTLCTVEASPVPRFRHGVDTIILLQNLKIIIEKVYHVISFTYQWTLTFLIGSLHPEHFWENNL